MDEAIKKELKAEINRVVDLMVQADAIKDSISELKKDIKAEYGIPIPTITKVATIIRKANLEEEAAKWEEITEFVKLCN